MNECSLSQRYGQRFSEISGRSTDRLRLLLLAVGLCMTTVSGCGGCGNSYNFPTEEEARAVREKEAELERKAESVKPKPLEAEKPPTPPPQPVRKPPEPVAETAPSAATIASPAKPKKPIRPEDVSEWKRDDYYSAKRDNDPRLVDAVGYLGRRFVGNENAAILLAKLLESPADDPFLSGNREENGRPTENAAVDKLTQAIVAALVANKTPHAQHTLEQLATGSIRTVAPQPAAMAAFLALLDHPSPKSEEFLLNLLLTASPVSDDNRSAMDVEQLRTAAVEPLRKAAPETFRTQLAKGILSPDLSQETFDRFLPCLKDPRKENLPAQILLYQSGRLPRKDYEEIQAQLIGQSGTILETLLGVRLAVPGTTSTAARHAALFWNDKFTASIQRQLRSQPSIEKLGGGVAKIAVTLPIPEVRATTLRFLEKHWEEGPKGLLAVNDGKTVALEPGFVAVLKLLPHKGTAAVGNGKDRFAKVDNRFMASTKAAKITEAREAKQRQDKTAQEWADYIRSVVQSTCKKFQTVSKSGHDDNVGLAFKLAPRAAIVGIYRLDWPKDLHDALSMPPTLRVRYVRSEQKMAPSKVAAYYRRQLPDCLEHTYPGGIWIDTTATDKSDNTLRSTDVLISKAVATDSEMKEQEQELIVEILSIECGAMASHNTIQQRQ